MADIIIKVLEPADDFALLTLEEAKVLLSIDAADTTGDAQLQMLIDQNSAVIAKMCNRTLAKEKVRETWRCLGEPCDCIDGASSRRLFLSHWPIKEVDIESVESPRGMALTAYDYELEEQSGKITLYTATAEPIVVTYTGGYVLPEEAPDDLKQAAGLLIRQYRTEAAQAATSGSGVRMLAHKESRVMYFSPKDMAGGTTTTTSGGSSPVNASVNNLLSRYRRIEI